MKPFSFINETAERAVSHDHSGWLGTDKRARTLKAAAYWFLFVVLMFGSFWIADLSPLIAGPIGVFMSLSYGLMLFGFVTGEARAMKIALWSLVAMPLAVVLFRFLVD